MTPLGSWILATVFTALLAAPAQTRGKGPSRPDMVLTAQSAKQIAGLLSPTKLGRALDENWTFESLSVQSEQAVFRLTDKAGRVLSFRLIPPSAPCRATESRTAKPHCLRSRHFLLIFPPDFPVGLRQTLASRIRSNDLRDPWHRPIMGVPSGEKPGLPDAWPMLPVFPSPLPSPARMLEGVFLLWLLITLLTLPRLLRSLDMDLPSSLAALGIFVLGLWLRLSATQPLPVGPNGHPNATILELFRPAPNGFLFYGNAFWAVFHLLGGVLEHLHLVSHPWQDALPGLLFTTNAVLGALIPLAVLALARFSGLSRTTSILGALLLACLPIHLRLSASESRFILGSFLLTLALVQSLAAWQRGSALLALAAILSWTLASQARPELALSLLALPFGLAAARQGRGAKFLLWTGATLALVAFLALDGSWLFQLLGRSQSHQGAASQLSATCLFQIRSWLGNGSDRPSLIWMDSRFVPPWLPILAFLGIASLALRRSGRSAVFWLVLSAASLATGACFAQNLNTARLETHSLPWLSLLAGQGLTEAGILVNRIVGSLLTWIPAHFSNTRNTGPNGRTPGWAVRLNSQMLSWVLAFMALFADWSHTDALLRPTCAAQREYLFVSRQVSHLPGGCRILLPDRQGIHNTYQPFYARDASGARPDWIVTHDPTKAQSVVQDSLAASPKACLLFYRPAACFADAPPGIPPESACSLEKALRRHWRLLPLATSTIPPKPCWAEHFHQPVLPIGFFRILPIRKHAPRAGPPSAGSP